MLETIIEVLGVCKLLRGVLGAPMTKCGVADEELAAPDVVDINRLNKRIHHEYNNPTFFQINDSFHIPQMIWLSLK